MTTSDLDREAPAPPRPEPADGRGLLRDYNRAAAAYWWLLAAAGTVALGASGLALAALPPHDIWQVLGLSVIAALVGMFPLRIPKTKTSIAAGDIFIFLLLLLHGPFAAAIAATAEAAACAWRTSDRWSSRIASPAAAAVAMLACGHVFTWLVEQTTARGISGDTATFGAMLLFAGLYFVVGPTLVTSVIYLKRWRAPSVSEWLTTFGWLGMGYLASASIAVILYLSVRQFGPTSVLVAVPMIGLFIASLRIYFAQQEASERMAAEQASRERADNAEREAALVARHLQELELSDRRFQSAFDHAAIGMALVSRRGLLVQVNPTFGALFGPRQTPLAGQPLIDLIDPRDLANLEQHMLQVRSGAAPSFRCELRCQHSLGHEIWTSMHGSYFAQDLNTDAHLIIQAFDVTARRLAEDRLQHLAYHDVLTDLANRSRLHDAVADAIEAHRADPARQFSVLHLSFDRFKLLSDGLGRGVGDQFLIAVARRIQPMMRPDDVLARLEGDDFGILAQHAGSGTHHALALADRLQRAFAAPVLIGENEVHTGAHIGITFSDAGYTSADAALRDAQLALSKSRAGAQAQITVFDPSLHEQASQRLLLETELRHALEHGELTLAYQPVFSIEPQTLVGFEALARWRHPVRGPISPADFIPVAEDCGLIVALTRWALGAACGQLGRWRQQQPGADELFVNVNIAGQDLCEAGFAELVRDTLAEHGLPARCLTLEITETALMQQLEMGKHTLARLRNLGVGLSVDDFGTGYSSLSHLSTLPINSFKIDRSFVDRLDGVSVETEIVRAVVQLGRALGKRVIAEGVESTAQLERLRGLGCRYIQGFLLARPLSVEQVDSMLPETLGGRRSAPTDVDAAATRTRADPGRPGHVPESTLIGLV
jgi:diguanylate cyclase (GGDEF)-like protein/PAS domain S-box-containing protein